jgi:hypothetical protein
MEERPMRMMMRMRTLTLACMGLIGIAACDDGVTNSVAFDEEGLVIDAALVAADGMFQDLALMSVPTSGPGLTAGNDTNGIEVEGSTSFSRTRTFFNAAGEEQERYDPETTASVHTVTSVERNVNHTFWSAAIDRDRDMWVTGLEGDEAQRTWNGTGTGDVQRSRHPEEGSERTYDMQSASVVDDVVRGVPRDQFPYPLSGTITRTIHAVITIDGVEEVRDLVIVITFDGDNTASMDVNGDVFEINLDERGVKKRFRRKSNG